MQKFFKYIILSLLVLNVAFFNIVLADNPQSTTYELKSFEFGAGGTEGADSTTFSLFGTAGEFTGDNLDSATYTLQEGLIFTMVANVPPAPSFTNPGQNYDRLKIILDNGGNASDAKFAIAISDDNFSTTRYIQSDYTVGSTLGSEDWLTYDGVGSWNGSSGFYVTGLRFDTEYKIKVKAQQGNYTETAWGPIATQSTDLPSLTFGISSETVTFAKLHSGNSFTDTTKSTTLSTTTNAYNGYIIYGHSTGQLTYNVTNFIQDYGSLNSNPTSWTGTGFGYTTDDDNLSGGTANRFTSGGPNYAGFVTSMPGDPVADHTEVILTPVDEDFTISYRVTASSSNKAGDYTTTLNYVVVPTY